MRLILLIHLIRRTPRTETYDNAGNMVQRDDEIFKYDSENKLVQVDKTVGDTVNYLYEHTGNRIRKSRTSTNEVVYNIGGVYEVTKIPSMSDRHTLYIRGIKEELVAQYTATDVVLLTDSISTNEYKAGLDLLFSNFKNTLDQSRIRFAKWVARTTYENPFALKLYVVYAILFCILLYGGFLLANSNNPVIEWSRNAAFTIAGLRPISLLLIVSVTFLFSNYSPKALTGGNRPQTPPYWLLGAFANEPASESVSTGGGNNPASPSSGFGGSASGSLSAGTPRLGMFFFHPDHTGSISMVTDGAGRMMTDTSGASQLTYKPYGEVNRMNSYGPDIFRYKYTSQQDDQDTGLYYYNARYYDPVLGSFTSADNVTNATSTFGLNHYMYTEGNPVRYGDASGNFLVPLLMAAYAVAVTAIAITAAVTIAAGLAVYTAMAAVANYAMTAGAMAQTATIATAAFAASAVVAAVRFAVFVDALGVVGAGVGFVHGYYATGTLKGALAGAELGFKIGTAITIAAWVVVGAFVIGAYVGGAIEAGIAFLGLHPAIAWILTYTLNFTIGRLFGELAKSLGRNIGGHWVPINTSNNPYQRQIQQKHGYNERGAYRGQAAGDFLSSSSSLAGGLWDATTFGNDCILNGPTYHSFDRMGAEIVGSGSFYFTEKIMGTIFQNTFDSTAWAALRKPQTLGSY
ncbi:MAG TPA: RHS repeat-associated core domain-containing protein [Leptospiraceae bacterium]|nr:RHS repeat-associated core domain-containing protein [Leptospiraceae bacterium]HNH01061.1 RHS repeat-associated core domain-containing protein [Leptospiraceae bacterium]HNM91171.1 RHS repeat-associated core domain-containing protein [Leptospiraceae bacterium]